MEDKMSNEPHEERGWVSDAIAAASGTATTVKIIYDVWKDGKEPPKPKEDK